MRFWDSSAIVPLCVRESWTDRMTELLTADPVLAAWWGAPVEVESALARLWREGALAATVADQARRRLSVLTAAWVGIEPTRELRDRALRLLRVHPLRAADALQLAAALVWVEEAPREHAVVSLDARLREAALREGFTLLPEEL